MSTLAEPRGIGDIGEVRGTGRTQVFNFHRHFSVSITCLTSLKTVLQNYWGHGVCNLGSQHYHYKSARFS